MSNINIKNDSYKDRTYWISRWSRFNSGDRSAFEEIYSKYIDLLYTFGSKLTNDKGLIKDTIQDIFIVLYNYNVNMRQPESLDYYLFKSFKRLILKKLKKSNKISYLENKDFLAFELTFNLEDEYMDMESEKEKLVILQHFLNKLSQSNRELLFYKFNSNLTYNEIGMLIGKKPDAVKKKIYRIISGLRESYNLTTSNSAKSESR